MDHQPWDAEKMLKNYIYDYMIKKNLHASAEAFKNEVDIPLGSTESFEFLQSKDFFATDKNRGLNDFIDLNDVCLEDNIEQTFFAREKGDIAEPSSMVLKQGPLEEEDAPKGDGD
ncbi:hypothetical protein J5N97_024104 [Dioscorea zingiberensis]|uniref:LisH domain-containing protein n=1 Tax=Dioscorea zingiberensis TaxID=325984 RepID=A0A9D5H8M3_9LILI|nr:hypothetical protein J5N97_024104 [Dioscorea zingiberensis]